MKTIIMRDVVRKQYNAAQLSISASEANAHCARAGGRLPHAHELELLCILDKRACALGAPRPVVVRPQEEWTQEWPQPQFSRACPAFALGMPYRCVCVIADDMFVPSGWLDITLAASLRPTVDMATAEWDKRKHDWAPSAPKGMKP